MGLALPHVIFFNVQSKSGRGAQQCKCIWRILNFPISLYKLYITTIDNGAE